MKKYLSLIVVLSAAFTLFSACTPGSFVDTDAFLQNTEKQTDDIVQDLNKKLEERIGQQIEDGISVSSFEMEPEDCVAGEQYDYEQKVCYYECETDEECAQLEAEILASIQDIGDDFFEGTIQFEEAVEPEPVAESAQDLAVEEGVVRSLIEYDVQENEILNPRMGEAGDAEAQAFLENTERHERLWQYFTQLFPLEFRVHVNEFALFTDGKDGTFASVYQDEVDPAKWTLAIDYRDAFEGEGFNQVELPYTMIHEFGHLLTLNETQIDLQAFTFEVPTGKTGDQVLAENEEMCAPRLYVQEGCSKESSTINQFYQLFWKDILPERMAFEEIEDDAEYFEKTDNFYRTYQDRFITEYAATNVAEDIAESWTAFVLKEKPENPQTIAEKKIAFFYEFPTLVALQQFIRARLV